VSTETANQSEWLKSNYELRMDANLDIHPQVRRDFHLDRYKFAKNYCQDKRVLDGACGTGYGSAVLSETAQDVVGIDCANDAVNYANATYANEKTHFQKEFVESTPFQSDSFDVVVSFETIEHTLCPKSHMMEIARLLEPKNGRAILSVPNAWGLTDHHFIDFDFDLFKEYLDQFFGKYDLFYQNPATHPKLPGIGPLTSSSPDDAQCLLAVCQEPNKKIVTSDRYNHVMDEIYQIAFTRHHDYLTLAYKQHTSLFRRAYNKLRTLSR